MDPSSDSSSSDNETLGAMFNNQKRLVASKARLPQVNRAQVKRPQLKMNLDDETSDSSDSDNEPLFNTKTQPQQRSNNQRRQAPTAGGGRPALHRRNHSNASTTSPRAQSSRFLSSGSEDDELVLRQKKVLSPRRVASVTNRSIRVPSGGSRKRPHAGYSPQPARKRARPSNNSRQKSSPKRRTPPKRSKVSDYPQKSLPLKALEPELGAPKWWEVPPYQGDIKWKTLDHNGILFPPPYKPHGTKILYDGRPVDLDPRQEELATFYAIKLETDHVKKKAFNKNFFAEFRKVLIDPKAEIKHPEICDFKKLNFRPIYDWAMKEREAEKERKKDPAYRAKLKEEKAALDEIHGYAIVDGVREKVGNYKVEPPGLFLGRGDHPKAGMLKKRLRPSQITLNIGKDAKIPPCPVPGEQWGALIHDPTVTYIAKWVENINQAHKMVYLHASSRFKGQADMAKYDKARKLKKYIGRIRTDYEKKLRSPNTRIRQLATCLWIIDRLSIRVGNEKDTDEEADTVGVCSFRVEHLTQFQKTPEGIFKVTLDFLGKDSMRYLNTIEIPQIIFKNLTSFVRDKKSDSMVFDMADPSMVNDYLKGQMDGLSAKVFRTHNASVCLQEELQKTKDFQFATRKSDLDQECPVYEKKYFYDSCNKQVAILCNHKRTVNQENFEKSTARLDEKIQKAEDKVTELRRKVKLASGKAKPKGHEEKTWANKDPSAFKAQLERKINALEKLKMNKSLKHENKEVALGTSKINYMDPRITVAFCKRLELPIEKVFNKALLDKFPWAMAAAPDFEF